MATPARHLPHLRHQGAVIGAFGRVLIRTALGRTPKEAPAVPGPEHTAVLKPRSVKLVADYLRAVGASPSDYGDELPAHFFPQWTFPLVSKTLNGIPYPIQRVLNGGCTMHINQPLPNDVPLRCRARLEGIDDNGRRAIMHTRLVTETAECPEALVCDFYSIVPLGKGGGRKDGAPKKEKARVPEDARRVDTYQLSGSAGLEFALLTGDFNPVHWIRWYAKAFGFKSTILHGFGTMSRAIESLRKHLWAGDRGRLQTLEVRFTRPLILPAEVGLFVDDAGAVFVGDAPGGPAYMTGRYVLRGGSDA